MALECSWGGLFTNLHAAYTGWTCVSFWLEGDHHDARGFETIYYDAGKYELWEKVDRFFNKLKQFRCIAGRCGEISRKFPAFVHLMAIWASGCVDELLEA